MKKKRLPADLLQSALLTIKTRSHNQPNGENDEHAGRLDGRQQDYGSGFTWRRGGFQAHAGHGSFECGKTLSDDGAVVPSVGPWREDIIKLLNDALATELVCVLRYKRHHFTAKGIDSPKIADEFLVHANEESAHADKLAQRITQLGGKPDFSPSTLLERSHADYDDSGDLQSMIRVNLLSERVAIEAYTQMCAMVREKDPTTHRMLVKILAQEQEHADELSDWLNRG